MGADVSGIGPGADALRGRLLVVGTGGARGGCETVGGAVQCGRQGSLQVGGLIPLPFGPVLGVRVEEPVSAKESYTLGSLCVFKF